MRTGCSGERESFSSACSAARFSASIARSSLQPGPGPRLPPARRLADRRQARPHVADQVDRGGAVGVQRVRRNVQADDLRLLAEAAAEAEPEVHRHADHQGHVGPLQRRAAGPAEGELVIGRQAATAEPVEEDRDPQRLGERPQLALAMAPVEAGAGHDRRSLRRRQQRRRLLDSGRRPGRRRRGQRRNLDLRLAEDDVQRIVDEGRPARRSRRQVQRRRGHRGDPPRLLHGLGRLDQRRDEGKVVDLLQRARAPAHLRRPPAQHSDRRVVRLCPGDRAEAVGNARPRGQRRDAQPPRRLRHPLGGKDGGLLMPHIDDPDPLLLAAVIYGEQMSPRQREEMAHAPGLQNLRDYPPPVRLHRFEPIHPRQGVPGAGLEPASPLRGSAF